MLREISVRGWGGGGAGVEVTKVAWSVNLFCCFPIKQCNGVISCCQAIKRCNEQGADPLLIWDPPLVGNYVL